MDRATRLHKIREIQQKIISYDFSWVERFDRADRIRLLAIEKAAECGDPLLPDMILLRRNLEAQLWKALLGKEDD